MLVLGYAGATVQDREAEEQAKEEVRVQEEARVQEEKAQKRRGRRFLRLFMAAGSYYDND
jgi:hypothetical protein